MTTTSVLLDGRPCSSGTGIGRAARTVICALADHDHSRRYSVMSWRKEVPKLRGFLGDGCRVSGVFPGRVFAAAERRGYAVPNWPLGSFNIFHGTSYSIPNFRHARTIGTFYDIAYRRLPDAYPPGVAEGFDRAVRRAITYVDSVVTVSHHSKGELMSTYGLDERRITVIYPAAFGCQRENEMALPARAEKPFVLFVGELGPRKNVIRLLRAFARVIDAMPHTLVLVGPDGAVSGYADSVRSEAARLALADRVQFRGWVPDHELAHLYQGCDAVLLPSLDEGFGYPLLDAMANGKPIVTSNTASMPEVAGAAAMLVNPLSVDEIAEATIALVRDDSVRHRLAEAGRSRVRAFTAEAMVAAYGRLYESLGGTTN